MPAAHRGTYLAFTDRDSDGMRHLRDLAVAGLNTLHLLPTNDIATIEEDRVAAADSRSATWRRSARLRPSSRRASTPVAGQRRLQLGLRPAALHDARGLLRDRPGRPGAHAASSAGWSRASTAPACAS